MIKLDNLVAVSGLPGLFKIAANRPNGLLIENIDTGRTKFASIRKHQFTPLETIGIYTYDDTEALGDIIQTMKGQVETNPVIPSKSPSDELQDYFRSVLKEYDEDKVRPRDIAKIIKWFNFMKERDLLIVEDEKEETKEAADKASNEEE
jgi:hypothetical protein